ncbi:aldose 1-epimerase isoform X2 [Hippocampus zosterae]|uniref:aldose 1-epimerase isoform X2 n=1 Tax=Hippocampus zosterae TaxID=109293 RepID=UPI00223C9A15|nr:aldose 1-epimerase isoform X2 [Hippocampus zosterae]
MTQVRSQPWGQLSSKVDLWTLQSSQVKVEVLTLGAIIRSVCSKGKDGQMEDVVLGYDDLEGYVSDKRFFGAVVGRVANRIAQGRFVVEGKTYQLEINNGPHALHGGLRGFNKGETLTTEYQAQSSKTTPINLTNHSYFNLAGKAADNIYDHEVSIIAHSYLPVDDTSIPTGEIKVVDGSPFDLRQAVLIGPRLKKVPGGGFDHNFCLSSPGEPWTERVAARVSHSASGRILEVSTSQPGIQFYTANVLDGSIIGKGGVQYGKHCSFCLETQNWPNAVNQASFPGCLLHPGEEYRHVTRYTFTCAD